jgi:hypothetical protein
MLAQSYDPWTSHGMIPAPAAPVTGRLVLRCGPADLEGDLIRVRTAEAEAAPEGAGSTWAAPRSSVRCGRLRPACLRGSRDAQRTRDVGGCNHRTEGVKSTDHRGRTSSPKI